RTAHQPTVPVRHQVIEKKFRGFLEYWIRLRQERTVGIEQVVLPQVLRHPGRAGRPQARARQITWTRKAPDVRDVMGDESAGTVVDACRLAPSYTQRIEKIEKRFVCPREIRDLRRPVVHLQVDVQMVVAVPR